MINLFTKKAKPPVTGWTPAPWMITHQPGEFNESHWIGTDSITSHAEVRNGADDPEYGGIARQIANANLIVAAPRLYANLFKLVGSVMAYQENGTDEEFDALQAEIKDSLTVLREARGETP